MAQHPDPVQTAKSLALCGLGAVVMRGAGCTINDIFDRKIDALVERTKNRPLASGKLSLSSAFKFLGIQLTCALGVLLQFNWDSVLFGASSILLVASYPLMKRFTYYPQFILGLAFNYGAVFGFYAMNHAGFCSSQAISLYTAGICWTMVYDTVYAHQDKKDDEKIGVKSTALKFAQFTRPILTTFAVLSTVGFGCAGLCTSFFPVSQVPCGPFYYVGVALAGWNMISVARNTNFDSRQDCARGFKRSTLAGLAITIGLIVDLLFN